MVIEITRVSSKGQIVIPEILRKGIEIGTAFRIMRQNDLIVLKPLQNLNEKDLEEIKELDKIWKDIDEGKSVTLNKKDFLKEMDSW